MGHQNTAENMVKNNRLDKAFGPVGNSAGVFLFVVGLITTYTSFYGLILVALGAFVGFTSTSTFIDFDKKRIKFSNNLFGIIQTGKWIPIEPGMKMGIQKSNMTWSAYSMGNRRLDLDENDFRILLFDSDNQAILPIKKTDSLEAAKIEMEALSHQLGLSII